MKNTKPLLAGLAGLTLLLTAGCRLLGTNAAAPGKFEESLFTVTNIPMVTAVARTNVVTVTNEVPLFVPHTVIVYETNQFDQAVLVTNTVTQTNYVPQVSQVTNVTPAGTVVQVPQLAGLTPAAQTAQGISSTVAGLWGFGGLATILMSGVGNWYQKQRNAALAASYTGATAQASSASVAAGTLLQSEQVLLQVLQGTPQGKSILPVVQNFLSQHKLEAGVVTQVAALVDDNVDLPAAREAAQAILDAAKQLTGPGTAAQPATVVKA